ncbi:DUF58 domain-containing protein [Methylomonas sp. WSC-6]|uniref:DUF58 domain-containing protein n=1 Tax=Methylomonas rivi TaxID=2952226 RepID=A0ABT1U9R3_9GAMM|nr:DUF58 domain-containing protein [Methylomonas sp. WSC-6]MCQ8130606.1 DUF58 domain-containing protein [Methylomonas sp. WSC-6]
MNAQPLGLKQRFKLSRFVSGEEPASGPIVLNQRRVFILPTRRGMVFVALIALVVLIAFVYNNNLAYMLGFLMASIFFVTILHSFKSLSGLVIRPSHHPPVFAGDKAMFNFVLHNPGDQQRVAIEMRLQEAVPISLQAGETRSVSLPAATKKRGWLDCSTLTLSSCYPLGLFRAWSPLRFDSRVLVYPYPAKLDLPFPETAAGQGRQGQSKRGGDEFYGLKSYQSGDPIRQIHWKAYAKGRGLHSKQYAGSASLEFWLDYDETPGGDVEGRLSQLCRWVVDAERAGLRYGLLLPGVKLSPDCGIAHSQACLRELALFGLAR